MKKIKNKFQLKKTFDKEGNSNKLSVPSVMGDSSGNNDLCSSSSDENNQESNVSENIINKFSILETLNNIYRHDAQKRIMDINRPIKNTNQLIAKRIKQERVLDKIASNIFKRKGI